MGWFWSKSKSASPDAAVGQHLVAMATASSTAADKERRRVEKQQAKEQKRREKELEKIAKKAMNDMKKQVKQAKKERAKAEKRVRNHARAVRKLQKKELSAQKKQAKREAKNAKRARQLQAKKAKAAVRRRTKEAKRRRKQQQELDAQTREQDELERQRVEAERDTARLRVQHDHQQNQQPVTNANDVVVTLRDAPAFKERTNCVKCTIKFKRLPKYRRHHCRHCGESFCGACLSAYKRPIPWFKMDKPQKVCVTCDAQVFATPTGTTNDVAVHQQPTIAPEEPVATTPLQRSASTMSEQPEDSPRSSRSRSRSSSRFIGFRLTRSRSDNNSSKGKKSSLWSLPIRPLLKRKASQDKLRNRAWDLDLMLEKEALLARQHKSQMMLVSGAPQLAPAV